jgi:hypothetical protein
MCRRPFRAETGTSPIDPIAARPKRACVLLAAVCFGAAEVRAQTPPAPVFGERSLHLLHIPFLFWGPADPAAPLAGAWSASLEAAAASTFSSTWHALTFHRDPALSGKPFTLAEAQAIHGQFPADAVFYVEGDLLRTSLDLRFGLSPVLSLSAGIVWISHDSVRIGSALESFHRTFGLDQPGRREFPSDAFAVVLQRPGGALTFDDRVPPDGWGDTTATLSWRPARKAAWSFGGDVSVKAPTGNARAYDGSGSWDAGALGFARRDGARWTLDAEAGFVAPGKWRSASGLPVAPFARFLLGATRSFGSRARIGATATVEQSPFRRDRLGDLSRTGVELGLGIERDFGRRGAARLTLTDGLPSLGDRADFGIALKLRY